MTQRLLVWLIEVAVVATAIHLFLRFVRTTRGIRLIRGMFVSVLGLFVVLWGLARMLSLEELEHVLQGAPGFIVVTFAIVFQPELRRAIAQIGEHSLVGRLMKGSAPDTLHAVVRAARSMAASRTGALIAFERGTSLAPILEAGTEVDAAVEARVLETIFYPGGALHDGGVVIRKDRIALAGCFFPLPQEGEIDPRLGTRHRAGLGLTEDSDAVVLIVSEESGTISLAKGGKMHLEVPVDEVEEELRRLVESNEREAVSKARQAGAKSGGWKRDLVWAPASVLIAGVILFVAHQDITTHKDYNISIMPALATSTQQPKPGQILVVLPSADYQLSVEGELPKMTVTGSRGQIDELSDGPGGVLELSDPAWKGGPLPLADVAWEQSLLGMSFRWKADHEPRLELSRFRTARIPLRGDEVRLDTEQLNPRYEVLEDQVRFEPEPAIRIRGPAEVVDELGKTIPLAFEPIALQENHKVELRQRLRLAPTLLAQKFSIEEGSQVQVVVPIVPARRDLGIVTKEIALVSMDPERGEEVNEWALPAHAQTARYTIRTSGLIPVDAELGSEALLERSSMIKRFVEENLMVFVDIADLPPGGEARSLRVRSDWRKDWRTSLKTLFDQGTLGEREELTVQLESDPQVLLERRAPEGSEERSGGSDGRNSRR